MGPLGIEIIPGVGAAFLAARLWPGEKGAAARLWVLVAISAGVLLWWQPLGLAVTLALAGATWAAVRAARAGEDPARKKRAVTAGVVLLVAVLVGFKYAPWLLSLAGLDTAALAKSWIVPLGLSFTVFRLIGALLDSAALKTPVSGRQVLLLSLFFPTFRSGPIESLQSLRPLEGDERAERDERWALERIFGGVVRKVVLADPLYAFLIAPWLKVGVAALTPEQCLVLPVLFGLYVYWDFSGYTDIAVGTAALLGWRVSENFNRPYLSRSLVEFWRRWHITLSEWIRTRLFMKMVGRRSPKWHFHAATVLSMALCGLWHGAGTNFLVWGLWHGIGLVGVHFWGEAQRRSDRVRSLGSLPGAEAASVLLTFVYVTVGWSFFFLPLETAWQLLERAALWRPNPQGLAPLLLAAGLGAAAWLSSRPVPGRTRLPSLARGGAFCVTGAVVVYLLLFRGAALQNFIYAQF